jgi:hypothetical protein
MWTTDRHVVAIVDNDAARSEAASKHPGRIYHSDKHNSGITGMSDEAAVEFFQHLNNAYSYLREIM